MNCPRKDAPLVFDALIGAELPPARVPHVIVRCEGKPIPMRVHRLHVKDRGPKKKVEVERRNGGSRDHGHPDLNMRPFDSYDVGLERLCDCPLTGIGTAWRSWRGKTKKDQLASPQHFKDADPRYGDDPLFLFKCCSSTGQWPSQRRPSVAAGMQRNTAQSRLSVRVLRPSTYQAESTHSSPLSSCL